MFYNYCQSWNDFDAEINIPRGRADNFLQLLTSDAIREIRSYFLRGLMPGRLTPRRSKRHYLTSAQ